MSTSHPTTCGCCTGVRQRTPQVVWNRPGLPELRYRSATHGDVLASLLAALTDSDRPALGRLRTRDRSDLTIALLDAWAVTHDVLTFYTERLANESYLRTAVQRTSLQELGHLVGHRLAPGAAAQAHLAFTIERPPATPEALPDDPGLAPPVTPAQVTLEAGLRVQSIPGPGEQPQTFETVEEVTARPAWNAMPVRRTTPWSPRRGTTSAYLAGLGLRLAPGATLLLAGTDLAGDRWDVRTVVAVSEDPQAARTRVTWDRGLGSSRPVNDPADAPEAFVLRERLSVFGHQAPVWSAMTADYRSGYVKEHGGAEDDLQWHDFDAVSVEVDDGADSELVVDVDGTHASITPGSWVVVSQETGDFQRELYRVMATAELSRSAFGVSGRATRLTLRGEPHDFGDPREVTVLAAAEPLTLVDEPDDSAVAGSTIDVEGDATGMAPGRSVIVRGTTTDGGTAASVGRLTDAVDAGGGRTTLHLERALPDPLVRGTVVVLGNVALATHGETVEEVLGDGDARRSFQGFTLQRGPVTHVQAPTDTGTASTLTVRVEDVAWSERDTLFDAGPAEQVHVTVDEPDGSVSVVFGDGRRGRRLPSGSLNVRARYRTGIGTAGNVDAEALSLPMDRPLGLKAVTNPLPATGGVEPDDTDDARRTIPLPVRTLGRAVSLQDYADFALAFAGIGLADASVVLQTGGRTIVVTVSAPDRSPAPATTVTNLGAALRELGDPYVPVEVLPHRPAAFRLGLKVRVHEDHEPDTVLAEVGRVLVARYAPGARELVAPVHRSEVIAAAATVPGVVGVDLDLLHRTDQPPSLRTRLLAAPARVDGAGGGVAAELLALADDPFAWLVDTT